MNLTELLKFIPLIIGAVLAYTLIVKQSLPAKKLGEIITYFIGILIVFFAVSWLITTFLAGWATDLLEAGTSSQDWQQFMNASERVVEDAFSSSPLPTSSAATVVPVAPANQGAVPTVTPHPNPGVPAGSGDQPALIGPTSYTVVAGDTLFGISQKYHTTVNDIMVANNLTSYIIQPGQVLVIPAPSK
ncbi:MAG: LysM peptidoglycan-binding domain-containing protein [Anaerolineae bacterium]